MKIDLDELEQIAKRRAAARDIAAPNPEWLRATAAYLDATGELVTLALVVRIRELEAENAELKRREHERMNDAMDRDL